MAAFPVSARKEGSRADSRWMLPEGIEEMLPPGSWRAEDLRRSLLDHYRGRSYDLILPPLIEHLDARRDDAAVRRVFFRR